MAYQTITELKSGEWGEEMSKRQTRCFLFFFFFFSPLGAFVFFGTFYRKHVVLLQLKRGRERYSVGAEAMWLGSSKIQETRGKERSKLEAGWRWEAQLKEPRHDSLRTQHILIEVWQKGEERNVTIGFRKNYFEAERFYFPVFFSVSPQACYGICWWHQLLETYCVPDTVLSPLWHVLNQCL